VAAFAHLAEKEEIRREDPAPGFKLPLETEEGCHVFQCREEDDSGEHPLDGPGRNEF